MGGWSGWHDAGERGARLRRFPQRCPVIADGAALAVERVGRVVRNILQRQLEDRGEAFGAVFFC